MKSEDLFEALSDIDDKLIYEAKESENAGRIEEYAEPLQITVTRKKFPWKTACAAAAAIIGVSAAAALFGGTDISILSERNPSESTAPFVTPASAEYPGEAKYVYDGDFREIDLFYMKQKVKTEFSDYLSLEKASDIIVSGIFADDARQSSDPDNYSEYYEIGSLSSYNKLKIDKVIKGDGNIAQGDEIIIRQSYEIRGGKLVSESGLTPMIKGDRWVYCLSKSEDGCFYETAGDSDSRYPLDDSQNRELSFAQNPEGIYEKADYKENIHEIILERFFGKPIPNPKQVSDTLDWNADYSFEMSEFPGVIFTWNSEGVTAEGLENRPAETLYDGMPVWDIYLYDINGDGKREICSNVSLGSGIVDNRIMAFDYANGELYELEDRGYSDYSIDWLYTLASSKSPALYYVKKTYNSGDEIEKGILTADIMKKVQRTVTADAEQPSINMSGIAEAPAEANEAAFSVYEKYGVTGANGKLYYNGEPVRYFIDYYSIGKEQTAGIDYYDPSGVIDVEAVRSFDNIEVNADGSFDPSGRLTGLKSYSPDDSPLPDKIIRPDLNETTAVYGVHSADSEAVETDEAEAALNQAMAEEDALSNQAQAEEAALNQAMTEEDILKAREELLKNAEEYKPFGVTYDPSKDCWYYNGELVRSFRDILTSNGENPTGGNFHGTMRSFYNENGSVDIETVRNYDLINAEGNGTLTDIAVK